MVGTHLQYSPCYSGQLFFFQLMLFYWGFPWFGLKLEMEKSDIFPKTQVLNILKLFIFVS